MNKMNVVFVLDPKKIEDGFVAGEPLQGKVEISVNKSVRCAPLSLSLDWETSGRGNVEKGKSEQIQNLHSGELLPGETYSFPFELPVPAEGPFSYNGSYLSVLYYLKLKAKIPFASDEEHKYPVGILPSSQPGIILNTGKKSRQLGGFIKGVIWFAFFYLILALGGFVVFLFGGIWAGSYALLTSLLPNLNPILAFVTNVFLSILFINFLRRRLPLSILKLKKPTLEVHSPVLLAGDPVPFGFVFSARYPVRLKKIRVALTIVEQVVLGGGKHATTHRNILFEQTKDYLEQESLLAGEQREIVDQFQLPANAPTVFWTMSNKIKCELLVEIHIAGNLKTAFIRNLAIIPKGYQPDMEDPYVKEILTTPSFFRLQRL